MGFYADHVRPHIVDALCGCSLAEANREKTASRAYGRVLELGIGGARNARYYDPERVEKLWGLEPNGAMRAKAAQRLRGLPFEVEFLELPGEAIPLDDASVDTVVSTCTLCTIPGVEDALRQVRRVLKPGGAFLFMEHGVAPDRAIRKWQDRINPAFVRLSCHVNRPIPTLIRGGGFEIEAMDEAYVSGTERFPRILKALAYEYVGIARPK